MWRRAPIPLALLLAFASPLGGWLPEAPPEPSTTAVVDHWPGWRGLEAQGRSAVALPTRWSSRDGVRWKTPIPGRGHSSPIVFGDAVYVTTAEATVAGALLRDVLRGVTVALALWTALLAFAAVSRRGAADHPFRTRDAAWCVAVAAATVLLVAIALSAEALFDFERGLERVWLISVLFVSACLALTAASAAHTAIRLAIVLAAVVFAGFAVIAFPGSELTFRAGISSLRMQIAIAACAAPIAVATVVTTLVSARRLLPWRVAIAVIAVAAGVAAAATVVVGHLLAFRDVSFPETTYQPRLRWWIPSLTSAPFVVLIAMRSRLLGSHAARLVLVSSAALTIVLTAVVIAEALATRAPYLAYQLGTPRLALPEGGPLLWMTLLAAMPASVWLAARRRDRFTEERMRTALAAVAMAAATIFFAQANYAQARAGVTRAIVSLDRGSGAVRWVARGLAGPPALIDGRNSPATPTPVTDGRIVCAYFGTPGMMCATTDGRVSWVRTDFGHDGHYGAGFSPVLSGGLVVVADDRAEGVAHIHALDARTGATVWRQQFETTPTLSGNSRTPIVMDAGGEKLVIVWGMLHVRAYALRSGAHHWTYELASGGDLVSSAVSDAKRLYLADASGTRALDADSLLGRRDPVRWTSAARANCASPVLVNGLLFAVTDSGVATAVRSDTGEIVWRQRLPGHYFASIVASPQAVYFTNSEGLTTVVAAGGSFHEISRNPLEEETMASMAAAGGELFIRTEAHVFAIGAPRQLSNARPSARP